MNKLLLYLVAFVVILPTTLFAVFFTGFGLMLGLDSFFHESSLLKLALFLCTVFGDLAILSMWILFLHYTQNPSNPLDLNGTALLFWRVWQRLFRWL
jgi:hypothetical protein